MAMTPEVVSPSRLPSPRRRRPVVGERLRLLLLLVFALFSLLFANSLYLLGVRVLEAATGASYQNWFYLAMFLVHLLLGLLFVVPVLWFGIAHMRNAYDRPNRRAVKVGYALFATALVLLASGVVLTRVEGILEVRDPAVRAVSWWLHVLTPVAAAWLFVIHRLAGKRIHWRVGARWAIAAAVMVGVMLVLQAQDPRRWNQAGPEEGERYFFPSLARTATGNFIPARVLQNDAYCQECHPDIHHDWSYSVHRFSSFNNPPYAFSVEETRRVGLERDGDVQASRFCAGCHDPVVFFSGKFDDPAFDKDRDPSALAGITCTVCHAITHINSVRGNSDYTIDEPLHYPFAFSTDKTLAWINRQLVKAKPELHKQTFLKPLHATSEFCSTCHKVHLPQELNHYKYLRGQNHYDSFLLSGVSGHGVGSFYYPKKAKDNCAECHMPLVASDDFGARRYPGSSELSVHRHRFPSANTGIAHLLGFPPEVIEDHRRFNEGVMRIDLFGIKEGGTIDGALIAPLRPAVPQLVAGRSYLIETVVRTVGMGHHFTQGTADSNEVWVELTVSSGGRVIGKSGGLGAGGEVDPWSHFVNVYMLDREGRRIDRRNAQDIFVPLYDHQIPPGAADVVHYRLDLPELLPGPVTVEARLRYRKFDTTYLRHVYGADFENDLPILDLADDRLTFPVSTAEAPGDGASNPSQVAEWERWNDYGIALLRKGGKSKGELRQAEDAFRRVEDLGRPDGPLNLARVYVEQGTVQDLAVSALERAARFDPPAPPWLVAWLTGRVNKENGYLDEAIVDFESILEARSAEMLERGFDFSLDYRLLDDLGQVLFERAKQERGEERRADRERLLKFAAERFEQALALDPENVTAHYNLDLVYRQLGQDERAREHREAYLRYKPDDNARDRAIAIARSRDPAASHAADAIVIYDLQRPGAFGLAPESGGRAPGS